MQRLATVLACLFLALGSAAVSSAQTAGTVAHLLSREGRRRCR